MYNGLLLSHKENAFVSVLMKWMNLELIILYEVNKVRKRKKYHILTQIWTLEIWYWWTYLQGSNGDADIENRLMETERGRSEWVKVAQSCPTLCDLQSWTTQSMEFWRRGWDKLKEWHGNICIGLCKTAMEICSMMQGAQPSALWQPRGEGWGGRWEGPSRRKGNMYTYGWFMLMYGRNQHNIVRQFSIN